MLLLNNKYFIGNFKNFIISNYVFTFKKWSFNTLIYLSLKTSKKSFFLACFLLKCFYFFNKIKIFFKKKCFHVLLSTFFFFNFFNMFIFSNTPVNKFCIKRNNSVSMKFKIFYNVSLPSANFGLYKKNYLKTIKPLYIELRYLLKRKLNKFFFFFFNFFQILFLKKKRREK